MHQVNSNNLGPMTASRMADFDKLPRAVRAALREADHNWSGTQILRALRKRKANRPEKARDAKTLLQTIRDQDRFVHNRDAAAGIVCGGQRPP